MHQFIYIDIITAKITNINNGDDDDDDDDDDEDDDDDDNDNDWNRICSQDLADSVFKRRHISVLIKWNVIFYNKQKCSFTLKILCLYNKLLFYSSTSSNFFCTEVPFSPLFNIYF
jgi:hypothetical protein